MGSSVLGLFLFLLVLVDEARPDMPSFDQYYNIAWGKDHVLSLHQGRELQISLDNSSGSAIESKWSFGSGIFGLKIKLPDKDSAGVVTAFYLNSQSNNHDELDFEFLGNREGKPHTLQTNVFANGVGNREQRFHLWFDPTSSFHTYRILWNSHQIVFFVDKTPIRVFKNNQNIGVAYPVQPMRSVASIWNGDSWATDGGRTKINWAHAPFKAHLRRFGIYGCPSRTPNLRTCSSSGFFWNAKRLWSLNPTEERAYEAVRAKYMTYDYCTDRARHPIVPPECPK